MIEIMEILFVLLLVILCCIEAATNIILATDAIQRQKAATCRAERFPSVHDRVRLYMSNWYEPPCSNYSYGFIRYSYQKHQHHSMKYSLLHLVSEYRKPHPLPNLKRNVSREYYEIDPTIQPDQVFYMDRVVLLDCSRDEVQLEKDANAGTRYSTEDMVKFRFNMYMYCQDTIHTLQEAWDHVVNASNDRDNLDVPILLQFGDMKTTHIYGMLELPHIKKFRSAVSQDANPISVSESSSSTCLQRPPRPLATVHGSEILQPIVWKLATHRHYRLLYKVYREDTPWQSKRNQAVFRGHLTGALGFYNKTRSDYENCMSSLRCRLVYENSNSKLVDAKLTSTRNRLPDVIHDVNITTSVVTIRRLLRFKAIIMLEGNDVASGLKWALLSQSVVLMPPPQHTSWAMEELLQPWVHYIPLRRDASDVEEKMQWIIHHDSQARWIAEQGSLWIEDLVFHPDAKQDDRQIGEEILRRYRAHFQPAVIA